MRVVRLYQRSYSDAIRFPEISCGSWLKIPSAHLAFNLRKFIRLLRGRISIPLLSFRVVRG